MNDKQKQVTFRVPAELHRQAKTEAAKTGKPLQDVLSQLIAEWLDKQREAERRAGESR